MSILCCTREQPPRTEYGICFNGAAEVTACLPVFVVFLAFICTLCRGKRTFRPTNASMLYVYLFVVGHHVFPVHFLPRMTHVTAASITCTLVLDH